MEQQLKLIIGSDLSGYDFKMAALEALQARGYRFTDVGCHSSSEGEYPPIAEEVARRVVAGEFDRGLLVCGTGQGMAMAANKVPGARCALCYDVLPALMSREHNNALILATGSWLVTPEKYLAMVEAWLFGKFSSGRHQARLDYMDQMQRRTFT